MAEGVLIDPANYLELVFSSAMLHSLYGGAEDADRTVDAQGDGNGSSQADRTKD